MARKKKVLISDDIDVTTLPFPSRTMLGQYMLKIMQERIERASNLKECFPCQVTLTMRELLSSKIVI